MALTETDMISALEAVGYTVVRNHDEPNAELRRDWSGAVAGLRIAADRVHSGARLVVRHPAYLNPRADCVKLLRDGVVRMIDAILDSAIVERDDPREGLSDAAE